MEQAGQAHHEASDAAILRALEHVKGSGEIGFVRVHFLLRFESAAARVSIGGAQGQSG